MPDGHVHQSGTISVAVTLTVVAGAYGIGLAQGWEQVMQMAAGAMIGVVLSPDLDIDAGFLAFKEVERSVPVFGWVVSHLFRLYWLPYSLLVPHRALLSHAPVLSTLVRLAYLLPVIGGLAYLVQRIAFDWFGISFYDYIVADPWRFWSVIIRIIIGLIMADTCHFFLDWAHGAHGKENRDGS